MEGDNERVKVKMGGKKGAAGPARKRGDPRRVGVRIRTSRINLGGRKFAERGVGDNGERSETGRGPVGAQKPAWIQPTSLPREGLGGK